MYRRFRSVLVCVCVAGLFALAPACAPLDRLPNAPGHGAPRTQATRASAGSTEGGAERAFYPLAIGNVWVYSGTSFRRRIVQGRDTLITRASWTRRDSISGRTVRGGREYFRVEMSRSGGWNVTLLRQDGSGLYEWDGSPSDQRDLAYPLHVGARWQWSFGTNRVEAREVVATPAGRLPAWRVWVDPGDSSSTFRQWVGTCGLIGIVATYHHEWVDPDGPRVIVDAEEREWLSSVQLVDDRREPAAARTSSEPTAARSRSEGAQARE